MEFIIAAIFAVLAQGQYAYPECKKGEFKHSACKPSEVVEKLGLGSK